MMDKRHSCKATGNGRRTLIGTTVVSLGIVAACACVLYSSAVIAGGSYATLRTDGALSTASGPTNRINAAGDAPGYSVAPGRVASLSNAPPASQSLYMVDLGMSKVGDYAVIQSNLDKANPPGFSKNATILSFGRPALVGSVWEVQQVGTPASAPIYITISIISSVIENYASAYIAVGGGSTKLHIIAGISNDEYDLYKGGPSLAPASAGWHNMLDQINTYFSTQGWVQVYAEAGYDVEMDYSDPPTAQTWLDGFMSTAKSVNVYDYGNITCPSSGDGSVNLECYSSKEPHLWHQSDIFSFSWNCPVCRALVQAYNYTQAEEWYQLSLYTINSKANPMQFSRIFTEGGACRQHPDDTCDPANPTYTNPINAWEGFVTLLGQSNPIPNKPLQRSSIEWLTDVLDDV